MLNKPSFTQRAVLHKNGVIHKHHVLHKNHAFAGPVQGLFAAYRIAFSMVARGTRRRCFGKSFIAEYHYYHYP